MEALGWLGGILLALCAAPQAYQTVRSGTARDLSWTFLLMWGVGDLMLLAYTFPLYKMALTCNYGLNLLLILVIIRVKYKEKGEQV